MRHHLPLALALAAPILLAQTPDTVLADVAATTITIGSQHFGASADELGPIGGGPGYQRLVHEGVHTVRTLEQLLAALAAATAGEIVHLPGDVEIDCTGPVHIDRLVLEIPAGVTLASDRGRSGSPGALLRSDTLATQPLLRTTGPGGRITGLRLQGPDRERRLALRFLKPAGVTVSGAPDTLVLAPREVKELFVRLRGTLAPGTATARNASSAQAQSSAPSARIA